MITADHLTTPPAPGTLIAASLLAARPARGRYAGEREPRPHYPRLSRVAETHAEGPRAARRAEASPAVRPPPLSPAERAFAARHQARQARRRCEEREHGLAFMRAERHGDAVAQAIAAGALREAR